MNTEASLAVIHALQRKMSGRRALMRTAGSDAAAASCGAERVIKRPRVLSAWRVSFFSAVIKVNSSLSHNPTRRNNNCTLLIKKRCDPRRAAGRVTRREELVSLGIWLWRIYSEHENRWISQCWRTKVHMVNPTYPAAIRQTVKHLQEQLLSSSSLSQSPSLREQWTSSWNKLRFQGSRVPADLQAIRMEMFHSTSYSHILEKVQL